MHFVVLWEEQNLTRGVMPKSNTKGRDLDALPPLEPQIPYEVQYVRIFLRLGATEIFFPKWELKQDLLLEKSQHFTLLLG